ncbi:SDR family NAD(P)-dependent oxidoreductase [Allostreptomyces psammosilenae]|uniref:NAD(P)-dependent dehydrogenase (Short-subunit alcohol dehydrogenase family) n=1 Tax=Allostreptomyces psammosilenae TaxID=1892865 RepID=A0A852ZZU6_9ACTN|nr:SDR family NAD(P)-dependent oxidoreductase [Allostreptomyces psammosilenae]NYI06740.1 NAD(P)-dependent dehydrogenase (short-subunit alcohol dehydrogenase family) [Allostreptomyces psammosilenae]
MGTYLISGGTDGIGRALAVTYLRDGHTVVVVGRSAAKFQALLRQAGLAPDSDRAHFFPADLRLVRENRRVVEAFTSRFEALDALVLCAAYVHRRRVVTEEGFEHTFALYYLSRYVLTMGLADRLSAAELPVVLNTSVPGARRDAIRWDDLQLTRSFRWRTANQLSRRANELLGLTLARRHPAGRIRHVLYSPGFVRSSFAGEVSRLERALITGLARVTRTPTPDRAIAPILDLVAAPGTEPVAAYDRGRPVPLTITPADQAEADRLHATTERLLEPWR